MTTEIKNGTLLLADGSLEKASICIENNKIKGFDIPGDRIIDATGKYVLPGIIDIHGDGFERVIMPRPNSMMPFEMALHETDRQILSSGITSAYYGISISWEDFKPLRNDKEARNFLDVFNQIKPNLKCRSLVHLRYEIYHTIACDWILESLDSGKIDLISFNDHLDYLESLLAKKSKLIQYADSLGMSDEKTLEFIKQLHQSKEQALEVVTKIAAFSNNLDIPMASHDEEDEATRNWYHEKGCRISEFPCNAITARKAVELGDWVVLGAPNALKGNSLYNRLSAREAIKDGICHILASDYYYPALLQIAFLLEQWNILDFSNAWNLISLNPAQACGLDDRGLLSENKSADIIIVDNSTDIAKCDLTMVQGKIAYISEEMAVEQDNKIKV